MGGGVGWLVGERDRVPREGTGDERGTCDGHMQSLHFVLHGPSVDAAYEAATSSRSRSR